MKNNPPDYRMKEMKISNEKSVRISLYILWTLLVSDVLVLLFLPKLLGIRRTFTTASGVVIFLLIVWRIAVLRIASLETSEYLFSLKYRHPFQSRKTPPVLEIPCNKIKYCKIKYDFPNAFLVVRTDTSKGKKKFCYRLGILFPGQVANFRKVLNNIKPSSDETGL